MFRKGIKNDLKRLKTGSLVNKNIKLRQKCLINVVLERMMSRSQDTQQVLPEIPRFSSQVQTPTTTNKGEIKYNWVVTFRHNIREEAPFEISLVSAFPKGQIPEHWYSGKLTDTNRLEKMKLESLSKDSYSVFCKVKKGKLQKCQNLIL